MVFSKEDEILCTCVSKIKVLVFSKENEVLCIFKGNEVFIFLGRLVFFCTFIMKMKFFVFLKEIIFQGRSSSL